MSINGKGAIWVKWGWFKVWDGFATRGSAGKMGSVRYGRNWGGEIWEKLGGGGKEGDMGKLGGEAKSEIWENWWGAKSGNLRLR